MQQYFENRELDDYKELLTKKIVSKRIYANETPDAKWQSYDLKVHNCTFAKMGFKESKFNDDNMKFNVFIDCYFKKTCFNNIDFTTSIFINCNFDESTFINCIFDYCKFENCYIKYEHIKESMPKRANIRWDLCKNLSLECLKLGQEVEYRKYFFEEKRASEQYYLKKFWHNGDTDYYNKYNGVDQISGLVDYILSKINKFLWGYGEKLSRLLINIILVIILFTCGYYFNIPTVDNTTAMSLPIAFYMSISNFITVTCDYKCSMEIYRILSVAEGGFGIILMGFFVAALFRHINRRG